MCAYGWMSEDNMWQPSFHHVCSVDETQVINLGDKHTCSQSHLTCPVSFLKFIYLLQEQKLCLVFSCSSIYDIPAIQQCTYRRNSCKNEAISEAF